MELHRGPEVHVTMTKAEMRRHRAELDVNPSLRDAWAAIPVYAPGECPCSGPGFYIATRRRDRTPFPPLLCGEITEHRLEGTVPCDGRALSCDEYPELFAVIGYHFGGEGDTFHVPKMDRTDWIGVQRLDCGHEVRYRVQNHAYVFEESTSFDVMTNTSMCARCATG